ncbi:hypothetical protein BAE44_0011801 [Dichanthelium oligosanthes]|uniref:Uncharacterized protein n=1 Tax=Dichanthelium oligosanthes TaxID=888268 RepID=A0A1E5VPY2_9POAL|nr:hypothetical protein BAE44_0011801 [Dichanthelium oligosanthes]
MEEFQEADVLWPDATHHHHACHRHLHRDATQPHAAARPEHLKLQSAPVRIPAAMTPEAQARSYDDRDDDDGTVVRRASGVAEPRIGIVPPHVLAARRCADERRVASSVCVGQGRTLKGRDLRAVRNAVLHMTGFLSSSDKY